jgi:hypothetical protein
MDETGLFLYVYYKEYFSSERARYIVQEENVPRRK